MSKKFAHLIVGFGIYEYFVNAINSVLAVDNKSDIIVITTGNPFFLGWVGDIFDYKLNSNIKIKKFIKDQKINNKIIFYSISPKKINNTKIGSLYNAYNIAFKYCIKNNIDYLNILQNDMQLIFWNSKLENLINELFMLNKDAIQINSGFPRKGSHSSFYINPKFSIEEIQLNSINKKKQIKKSINYGISDWGICNVKKCCSENIFWKISENYMAKEYLQKGYKIIFSPIPFVGVIPWPVVARNNKIIGSPPVLGDNLYLKPVSKNIFMDLLSFEKDLWQEEWIKPNGWYALHPCIYTDFSIKSYLKNLLDPNHLRDTRYLKYVSSEGEMGLWANFTFKIIRPRLVILIFSYVYNFLLNKITKKI